MANTLTFSPTQPGGLFGSPIAPSTQTSTMQNNNKGGLFGTGYNYSLNTGFTPVQSMGSQAVNPAANVTPPTNTLAPGQTTTQGNQASPQPTSTAGLTPYTGTGSFQTINGKNYSVPTPATPVQPTTASGGSASSASTGNTSPASTGIPGTFSSIVNNQANTQPYTAVGNAVGTSQGVASGIPSTQGVGGTNQNNAYSAQGLLGQFATNQTPAVLAAEQKYNTVANNPYMIGALQNSGMAESVSAGAGQQFATNYANQLSNANQNVQNALTGEQQQISSAQNQGNLANTGISNQLQGANQAGNLANSAQSNQIGAQQNAASNVLNSLAQQGYVIINKTTGQPLSTQGAMSAAFTGGQTGAAETAGGNTFAMNQANTAAKGIQGTIQQFLASNPNINSNTSTLANAAQQWLSGQQLGDPNYQTLFNYLNEYTNTLAPILGVGGDPTNLKTQIAQGFINAQASGQSISQVLNTISSLADQKLANLTSAGQGGGQVAGGTPQGSNPTSFGSEW